MKVSKVYEVWVGGDMIDDQLDFNTARKIAEDEFNKEQLEADPADVVVDEHSYMELETIEDVDGLMTGTKVEVTHFGEDYGKVEVHLTGGGTMEYEVPLSLAKILSNRG